MAQDQQQEAVPVALDLANSWLTDRTRIKRGRRCAYARWMEFHEEGTGLKPVRTSVPLATGTHVHGVLEGLLKGEEPAEVMARAVKTYRAEVAGFLDEQGAAEPGQELSYLVEEQARLVEGLGWALHIYMLPRLLDAWEVVEVERERPLQLGNGVVLATRADFVMRHRRDRALAVWDGKTCADPHSYHFMRSWDSNPQLTIACRAVEAAYGEPVPTYWVLGMGKGERRSSYDPETREYSGPRRQNSALCYAYYRAANPPFESADWKVSFNYTDEDGKARKLGKGYSKVPLWESGMSAEEWVRRLPETELRKMFCALGPLHADRTMQDEWLRGVQAEEERWRALAWEIHEAPSETHAELLSVWAPRSWDCHEFGRRCEFWGACTRVPGWRDGFKTREPHHAEEREQWSAGEGSGE